MNKKRLFSTIFILSLLLSGTALAQENATRTLKINELKEKVQEKRLEAKERLASTTEKLKKAKEDSRKEAELRIGKKLDERKTKIANAFEKAIENLKDLADRVESRILKMESENINTTSARSLLTEARTKLALAETELLNLENLLLNEVPANSTSTTRNDARKAIIKSLNLQSEKTKSAIKVAHRSIVEVITSLKRGLMKEKNSTSTESVSTTSTTVATTTSN